MTEDRSDRLKLVSSNEPGQLNNDAAHGQRSTSRDLDWTILMARSQNGDADAYRRLLEEIAPYLRALARRWHKDRRDIEDSVQDILLTVHSIRHTYDPSRPFGPWLIGIANRRVFDRLRRQGRQRARETPLTTEHDEFAAPSEGVDVMSERHLLEGAIDSLPPAQQQAIRMLKLKEMSLKEASTASGMSIASLKVATHRALKSLQKMLIDRSDT